MMEHTTTTADTASMETTRFIDCFEVMGNKTVQIESGSSSLDDNCTKMSTCINGGINERDYNCSVHSVCDMRSNVRKCYCVSGYHGDGVICTNSTNCMDVFNEGYTSSGLYSIKPSNWNGSAFDVYCNMSQEGGWTVFQRRVDGSVDFYRNWTSYEQGFGDLENEFWLGNDKLYSLTNQGAYILRIDLINKDGDPYYAEYDLFRISDESDNYTMSELGAYSGTTGELGLRYHRNFPFSTFDRDNDAHHTINCAAEFHGAWWYGKCARSNLNGDYHAGEKPGSISWVHLPGSRYNIKYTEMKMRPKT